MKRIAFYALSAGLLMASSPICAQSSRPFENSWFWGVQGGTIRFSTNIEPARTVGTFGGDWLITRKTGGLYVSFDMANFSSDTRIADSNSGGGFRQIQINDLKRIGVAGMAFPVKYGRFRPYGGVGFSLDIIGDAEVRVDSAGTNSPPDRAFLKGVEDRRSQIGLLFIGGTQAEFARLAAFAQASVVPNVSRFLIGRDPLVGIQFGLRYNIGTSIDRAH